MERNVSVNVTLEKKLMDNMANFLGKNVEITMYVRDEDDELYVVKMGLIEDWTVDDFRLLLAEELQENGIYATQVHIESITLKD